MESNYKWHLWYHTKGGRKEMLFKSKKARDKHMAGMFTSPYFSQIEWNIKPFKTRKLKQVI
jgi:hypothetical protein